MHIKEGDNSIKIITQSRGRVLKKEGISKSEDRSFGRREYADSFKRGQKEGFLLRARMQVSIKEERTEASI